MSEYRNDFEQLDIMYDKERVILSEIRRFGIISASQLVHLLAPKRIEGEALAFYTNDLVSKKNRVILTNDNHLVWVDAVDATPDKVKCLWPILENSVITEESNEESSDDEHFYSPYGIKARFPIDNEMTCKAESPAGFICFGKNNKVYIFTPVDKHCESTVSFLQERYYARQVVRVEDGKSVSEATIVNFFVTESLQATKAILEMKNLTFPFVVCEVTKQTLDNGMPNIKYYVHDGAAR